MSDPTSQFPTSSQAAPMSQSASAGQTSGMAIASMILGVIGILTGCVGIGILLGLVGLILGIIAVVQIGKPGYPTDGKGMAITGIVTGAISVLIMPLLAIAILLPALGAARSTAQLMQAQSQLRMISLAQATYAVDYNGHFPDDIGILVEAEYLPLSVDVYISPFQATQVPVSVLNGPISQQAQWTRMNASYILVPGLAHDDDGTKIAVFGRPDHFKNAIPMGNVAGHVEAVQDISGLDLKLQNETGMTIGQLITRQEQLGGR